MGRKIAGHIIWLAILLAALYGQQEIFTQTEEVQAEDAELQETDDSVESGTEEVGKEDGDEDEKQEEPPLPYEILYGRPNGENQYYTVKPEVTVFHPGNTGETVYVLQNDAGAVLQGRLSDAGSRAVIGQESFAEGTNRLQVWIEYIKPSPEPEPDQPSAEGQEEEPDEPPVTEPERLYEQTLEFKVDTCAPALSIRETGGNTWKQYQTEMEYKTYDNAEGSGIKNIVCYVNGKERECRTGQEGAFVVRSTSVNGKGIPVKITVYDMAGNSSGWEGQVFVDSSPPDVQIREITDYMITSRDVSALFAVSDDNTLKSCSVETSWITPEGEEIPVPEEEWQAAGERQMRQTFSRDGIYRMHLKAEDMAGFQSEASAQVIVDKNNPVISYIDEIDGTYVKEFCWERPIAEIIRDFTSYTYTFTLDGHPYLPGQKVQKEGRRILEAEAVDAAGNRSKAAAEFVIDHTAPKIVFENTENGMAYEGRKTCTIRLENNTDRIREVSINGKKQPLSGKKNEFTCELEEYRVYKIKAAAVDRAGNEREDSVLFEVVPEKTFTDKLLSPVRETLGLEEKGFKRENDGTAGKNIQEEKTFPHALLMAAVASVLIFSAAAAYIIKRRKH